MVSQHPDNACKPFWHTDAFISDQYEVKECYYAFSKLGVSEYKWDWEGKFVDESVFERLISQYFSFFQKNPLGKEKFLTFRVPDFRVRTEFRFGRALMCLLSAAALAKELDLNSPPMFEVILSMTQSAEEMIGVQEAFCELAALKHPLHNKKNKKFKNIEIIPLFEHQSIISESSEILKQYLKIHKKKFKFLPKYIRPYLARSDSALSSGLIPSVLSIKIALSKYSTFENETGIKLYPIIGAGSLPFRGGSTPYTVTEFINEYKGIRTMLIQSAFQYDFPLAHVNKAIKEIDKILPKGKAVKFSGKEEKEIEKLISIFEPLYKDVVKKIGSLVYRLGTFMPARRERLKHTGLLKYPRTIDGVKVPRAINFTASLYSLGIPPEFIGTGRGIKECLRQKKLDLVEKYYLGIRTDLERAGRYLNKTVLEKMAKKSKAFRLILEDVSEVEKYLGKELGPITVDEKAHKIFTGEIYERFINGVNITGLIEETAVLRKSLG